MLRRLHVGMGLQMAVGITAFLVITIGFMDRDFNPFWLAIVAFGLFSYWRGSAVLRVDRDGVLIGRGFGYAYGHTRPLTAKVPWTSIVEVLLIHAPTGEEQVGVRLRHDAPLPWNVQGVIRDPNAPGPVAPELRTALPQGKLDCASLTTAVGVFGNGVPVVDVSDA